MDLLVNYPKVGFGSTNYGNTSRRFFADPDATSQSKQRHDKQIQNDSRTMPTG